MSELTDNSAGLILSARDWRTRRAAHEARTATLIEARRQRAALGVKEPVEDFLFTYYPFRFSALQRWSPGAGVGLEDAAELVGGHRFERSADGLVRVVRPTDAERHRLNFTLELSQAIALRPAFLGCFGLHEWAMVFNQAADRRHGDWPLRLGAEGTDAVVRASAIRCTHYDAFRFFTPGARPLNRLTPTLEQRVQNEQPGCVHVTMDLYKWTMKAQPWVSSELAADSFELARDARAVDMRASPYDFSAVGLEPICIETPEGRSAYESEQRRLTKKAEPVRARLIAALKGALA